MRIFLSAVALFLGNVVGRWSGGSLESDNPLMVVYVENWAGWARNYFVSDLEKYVLSRNIPVRNWVLNYAFLTWNAVECRIAPTDSEIDFAKGDPHLYPQTPTWWSKGITEYASGSLSALLSLKQKYPYIKLIPSLGGWSRSHTFHGCLLTKPNVMVQSAVDVMNSFGFDGIDFDWEYPNCDVAGAKCGCQGESTCWNSPNVAGEGDWVRYKQFLEQLRVAFDDLEDKLQKRLYITAAVGVNPKVIDGGNDIYSVGTPYEWICENDLFDWVNLMTYDYYGPWAPKTGPLAPLYSTPDSVAQIGPGQMSIEDSVERILSRCAHPEKLTMGLPAYGKLWKNVPRGNGTVPGLWATSSDTNNPGASGTYEVGTASFWDIKKDFETSPSCIKTFDENSKTATLYCENNPKLPSETNVFISYDDGRAWQEKMAYARSLGFAGGIIWAASDMGNYSPDHISELFAGAFQGWLGTEISIEEPYSNGPRDFRVPEPFDNFPCPIPFGANQADMNPIPNDCYGPGVNETVYHDRDPWVMPTTNSVPDRVGKDQRLIHKLQRDSSSTTTEGPSQQSSSQPPITKSEAPLVSSTRTTSVPKLSSSMTTQKRPDSTSTKSFSAASSTASSSVVAKCQSIMDWPNQEVSVKLECQELCKYYFGGPWCDSTSLTDGTALAQCVISFAPYCGQAKQI